MRRARLALDHRGFNRQGPAVKIATSTVAFRGGFATPNDCGLAAGAVRAPKTAGDYHGQHGERVVIAPAVN